MKNIFLLTFMALFMFSCDTPVPAESEAERAPGFLNRGGEIFDATDANPENLDLWDKYIDAPIVSVESAFISRIVSKSLLL